MSEHAEAMIAKLATWCAHSKSGWSYPLERSDAEAIVGAFASLTARAEAAERNSADWHGMCQVIATILGLPEPEQGFPALVRDKFEAAERDAARMREAIERCAMVADEVAEDEDHGDGADDPDCEICRMHAAIRAAQASTESLTTPSAGEEVKPAARSRMIDALREAGSLLKAATMARAILPRDALYRELREVEAVLAAPHPPSPEGAVCPASYSHTPEPHRWTGDTSDGRIRCVKCSQLLDAAQAASSPTPPQPQWTGEQVEQAAKAHIRAVYGKDFPVVETLPRDSIVMKAMRAALGAVGR